MVDKLKKEYQGLDTNSRGSFIKRVVGRLLEKGFSDRQVLVALVVVNVFLVLKFFSYPFTFAFSAPVVPLLAGVLGWLGVDYAQGVRWVLLVFYIFGPVTLYFLVREVTKRRMSALSAAILYSLPIFRSRFEAMTTLGDGAHIASLTLVPLAGFWLLRFLKSGSFWSSLATGLLVMLVALISPFGLFILVAVMVVITFSEMLLGNGRLRFMRFLWVFVVSTGLSAFWYNPQFASLTLSSPSGQAVIAGVKNLIPLSLFIIPVLGAIGFLIFDKRPQLQPLFIALGLTVVFGLISYAEGLARFAVSGQERYLPELVLSIAFLWGIVGTFVYDLIEYLPKSRWFPVPKPKRELLRKALVYVFALVCLAIIVFSSFDEPQSLGRGRRRSAEVNESEQTLVIDISTVRKDTSTGARVTGYAISAVTIGLLVGMQIWIKRQKRRGLAV